MHDSDDDSDARGVRVTPRLDGPLVVEGTVSLIGPDGAVNDVVERLFLCRCGASGDKPRCDGTHKRIGFEAAGVEPPRRAS
jgi:CDGSH-type Zn-finger protein